LKKTRIDPRLWALLDDACWLVFRLFGVTAYPRLSGINRGDRLWEDQFPWICRRIHEQAVTRGGRRACRLAEDGPGNLPSRGCCISGLVFRTIPLCVGPGLTGTLVLGPFLSAPPSEQGFQSLCARLGVEPDNDMHWTYWQSPVLPPSLEPVMVDFCRRLFGLIWRRYAGLLRGKTWEETIGAGLEHIYPPLRLAYDFPLHVYGVFVMYWEPSKDGEPAPPLNICDLEYVDRGRVRVEMKSRSFEAERGQAFLLLPHRHARIIPASVDGKCETISISFQANSSLLNSIAERPLHLDTFEQTLLSRLCRIAVPRDDASHRDPEVKLLLTQLLMRARKRPAVAGLESPTMPAFRRIRNSAVTHEIRHILEQSAEGNISLRELAERVHMSVPTLKRVFKSGAGTTPMRYHRMLRMQRAELLLRHGMLTVSQIADKLGFSSLFHFSKAFKQSVGVTPTEFASTARSARQQVERGKVLLHEKKNTVEQVAKYLEFPTMEAFRKVFIHYVGVPPEDFAKSRVGRK